MPFYVSAQVARGGDESRRLTCTSGLPPPSHAARRLLDVEKASGAPKYVERFCLVFQAGGTLRLAMSGKDLQTAELDALDKQWR